ncbi:MAG: hypothetical protein WBO10_16755 [Pyrinomonadaceae bacterium]
MKCSDLQFNLALHADGLLADKDEAVISDHMAACPLCRQAYADHREIRIELRQISRPVISDSLRNRISEASRAEPLRQEQQWLRIPPDIRQWIQMRVMPYGVGVFASSLIGLTFLTMMFSSMLVPNRAKDGGKLETSPLMLATNSNPYSDMALNDVISPTDFARSRLGYAAESPSINPQGALIALTKSLMRGGMKDEEVVVVADVFGNGLAQVAEVIEPSSDRRAVRELEKALESDPTYAPFVPSSVEARPDSVRVVLRFQTVNVSTGNKSGRTRL